MSAPGTAAGDPGATAAALGAMVRAGLTPAEAFAELGWPQLAEDGAPLGPAPAEVVLAARLAHATGAPLAPVLDALTDRVRADREAELARESALAGPRLSARILTFLPVAGVGLAVLVDTGVLRVLASPVGAALIGVAAALTFAGHRWMRRLVRRAQGPPAGAVSPAAVATALRASMNAGQDVRGALTAVSAALAGRPPAQDPVAGRRRIGGAIAPAGTPASAVLATAARVLGEGGPWEKAWEGAPDDLVPIATALRLPWYRGAAAGPMLAVAADELAFAHRQRAVRAAGELGVRLALPLALCLLPAFVVGGIVPLLVSLVGGLR